MNFAKRAVLYILRKKGKTVSLFLLIFTVAVFLISCFGVLNASEGLSKDIRTSLGAAFYIRANTEVFMNEKGETEVRENSINIPQSKINEIMRIGEGQIKYCNPVNYGFAKSDALHFIPGEKDSEESNMGKVTALSYSALASDFADERSVLVEGRHITKADTGKIVISERLADINHISVGDVITLTHAKLGACNGEYIDEIPVKTVFVKVEVSGIYRLNTEDISITPTAGIADNEIYASLDVLDDLKESEAGIYTGEVGFYITDPAKLDSIAHNVQLMPDIDWTTHFIRTNDFQYSRIADRLSSLGDFVKILLVCISFVSTAVLTLILSMRIRGRMQEAGILLAAGISKRQILGQFLLEVLSVTVIAFVFSYFVSLGVAELLAYSVFNGLQPRLLNEGVLVTGINSGMQMKDYLKPCGMETLFIYLCQFIVVAVSTLLSSLIIMRLKPKEILSKMS